MAGGGGAVDLPEQRNYIKLVKGKKGFTRVMKILKLNWHQYRSTPAQRCVTSKVVSHSSKHAANALESKDLKFYVA